MVTPPGNRIRNEATPNLNWIKYAVRLLTKTPIADYSHARAAEARAVYTSTVEATDTDDKRKRRRTRKKTKICKEKAGTTLVTAGLETSNDESSEASKQLSRINLSDYEGDLSSLLDPDFNQTLYKRENWRLLPEDIAEDRLSETVASAVQNQPSSNLPEATVIFSPSVDTANFVPCIADQPERNPSCQSCCARQDVFSRAQLSMCDGTFDEVAFRSTNFYKASVIAQPSLST